MKTNNVLAIFKKDVVDSIRNRYLLIFISLPIVFSLIFSGLFTTTGSKKKVVLLYSPDNSQVMLGVLNAIPNIQVLEAASENDLQQTAQKKGAIGGLVLPEGYDTLFSEGKPIEITAYSNPKATLNDSVLFQQIVNQIELSSIKQPATVHANRVDLDGSSTEKTGIALSQFLLIVALLFTLVMVGGMVVPLLLVDEKEKRTFEFLQATPTSPAEVMIAKSLTGLVYCFLVSLIILIANREHIQAVPECILATFLGAVFIVFLGLLLGLLFINSMQVNTWAGLVMAVLLLPSIAMVGNLPAFLDVFLRALPTYYFVDALRTSVTGSGAFPIWLDGVILAGCSAIVFAIILWKMQRKTLK